MFGLFKKKKGEEKREEEIYPVGAILKDNDHPNDERFMKVVEHKDSRYGLKELRCVNFPMRNEFFCEYSWSFIKERFTRLTPAEEEKWNKEYFADKAAYFKKEEDGWKKKEQDRVDSEKDGIKNRIDEASRKHIVIYCGNAISFESLLDYAIEKGFILLNTAIMPNGVFVGILNRK